MTSRLSQPELESYLWGAAIILRGLVDAGDYKQYIFPLLFYKRLSDVWDADYAEAFAETEDKDYAEQMANERFSIPPQGHWNDVREKAKDVGKAIQNAFRAIEAIAGWRITLYVNGTSAPGFRKPGDVPFEYTAHSLTPSVSVSNGLSDESATYTTK